MDYIRLIRPWQWYKNLLVFIAVFFTGNLLDIGLLWMSFLGFASLCLVSSSYYIINDIVDRKSDRMHPEKKSRPVASGRVGVLSASVLSVVLLSISVAIAFSLSLSFLLVVVSLFVLTQLYTFFLKDEPFIDMILIGVNFVLRAISGTFIVRVDISPWLVIGAFFVAMFLAAGKRKADLMVVDAEKKQHRKVYRFYDEKLLDNIILANLVMIIISYSLYSFINLEHNLILTLPFFVYVVLKYYGHIMHTPDIARNPHLAIKDWKLVLGFFMLGLVVLAVFYSSSISSLIESLFLQRM